MVKWSDKLWIFTVEEYNQLPNGTKLKCIDGSYAVKGIDYIDDDVRGGHMAYGIESPASHSLAELFSTFRLKG